MFAHFDVATAAQTEDALAELTDMTGGGVKGLVLEPCETSVPPVIAVAVARPASA
jgi:hypothetical protein